MKRFTPLVILICALPSFAAGPEDRPTPEPTPGMKEPGPWPQKGQVLYLNAAFTFLKVEIDKNHGPKWKITREERTIPACSSWTVIEGASLDPIDPNRNERVLTFIVKSAGSDKICLKGEWSKVIALDQRDCAEAPSLGSVLIKSSDCHALGVSDSDGRIWIHN